MCFRDSVVLLYHDVLKGLTDHNTVRVFDIDIECLGAGGAGVPVKGALRTEVLQLVPLVRRRVVDDKLVLIFACTAGCGRGQGCLGLRGEFAGRLDRERGGKAAVRDVHAGQCDAGDIGRIGRVPDVHIQVLDTCRAGVPGEGRQIAVVLKLVPLVCGLVVDDELVLVSLAGSVLEFKVRIGLGDEVVPFGGNKFGLRANNRYITRGGFTSDVCLCCNGSLSGFDCGYCSTFNCGNRFIGREPCDRFILETVRATQCCCKLFSVFPSSSVSSDLSRVTESISFFVVNSRIILLPSGTPSTSMSLLNFK